MSRIIYSVLFSVVVFFILFSACADDVKIDDDHVMQLKDVGLREGVFVRRFQLTGEYGAEMNFTAQMLQSYISRIIEPDYLLIQHAFDLGFHNEDAIALELQDYRVNLLANSHPVKTSDLNFSQDDLRDYYSKRRVLYDIELIQTKSYKDADSLRRLIREGGKIKKSTNEFAESFPTVHTYKKLQYGQYLHPVLFPPLPELNKGDVSTPLFTNGVWSIIKLNDKKKNRNLADFEEIEQELIGEAHTLFKYNQQEELVKDLRAKFLISIDESLFTVIVNAFEKTLESGFVDKQHISAADLQKPFVRFQDANVSLATFVNSLNKEMPYLRLRALAEQDVKQFVDDFISQHVLYVDALEKGVAEDVLIKDKLENKVNRTLLRVYLVKEIAGKINITEKDARSYFERTRSAWKGEYEQVAGNVKSKMRGELLEAKKKKTIAKLSKKYKVVYNKQLLEQTARNLTLLKKTAAVEK